MIILGDILFALALALLLALLMTAVAGRRAPGPGGGLLFFFALLFFFIWAAGIWIPAFGPVWWGIALLPFVAVGVLFFLLLLAVVPPTGASDDTPDRTARVAAVGTAGLFFYIALLALFASAVAYYV